jgi:hypothetical protein
VVEALRVGVKLDDVLDAIETRWAKLGTDARVTRREVSRR